MRDEMDEKKSLAQSRQGAEKEGIVVGDRRSED